MLWKTARQEIDDLKRQNERGARDREAARLNLQRSLKRLSDHLGKIQIDESIATIGSDLAGNRGGS